MLRVTIVANNKNMTYSVKMYENTNIYNFDLKKMDMNAKEIKYTKPQNPVFSKQEERI